MAGKSHASAKGDSAEGAVSADENKFAPRLRPPHQRSENITTDVNLASPSSASLATTTTNPEEVKMGPADAYGAANGSVCINPSSMSLLYGGQPYDDFGPLEYGPMVDSNMTNASLLLAMIGHLSIWLPLIPPLVLVTPAVLFNVSWSIASYVQVRSEIINGYVTIILGRLLVFTIALQVVTGGLVLWLSSHGTPKLALSGALILYHMVHLAFWFQIRHKAIVMHRPRFRKLLKVSLAGAIKEYFPFKPRFILAVAGSGGHTTELLNILTHYEPFNESSWRRWVVNEGDQGSINRIDQYELALKIKRRGRVSGAYQMFTVPRARKVGQSWLTTLLTTPYSCLAIAKVFLTGLPENTFCQVTYPHVILINGPGTAFAAALVIYLLKLTGIAPINRCKIIFIESITRVNSLSLTGKFLYYMNIADFFIVQHSAVEKKYEGIHLESYLCARQWTLSMHNRH